MTHKYLTLLPAALVFFVPALAEAREAGMEASHPSGVDLIGHPAAIFCLIVFVLSYVGVLLEEKTALAKSKPVMLGAGIIWIIIAFMVRDLGGDHQVLREAVSSGLEEYSALLLFLLSAMTYISALQDRKVFAALRSKLVQSGLNIRQIYWITGFMAFFISAFADNLTTALIMGSVVMAVGGNDPRFVSLSCINLVSAANAGGAFSPFGDITTLMVWQAQKADFFEFFELFLPALANFFVPALIISFFVPKGMPWSMKHHEKIKPGGRMIIFLGLGTIALAVAFEQVLGLPPFLGMMTGLAVLMFWAYYVRKHAPVRDEDFDIFKTVATAEWDTLLFFFGVIFSVGGLTFIGYLGWASHHMFDQWGPGITNIALGFSSAIIDNIPVMFAVLSMNPHMDHFQWLLITLTTGVGGSLLSVGSAAGVALMGLARGQYTFLSHLKWTPAILLGYGAGIGVHFLVNG